MGESTHPQQRGPGSRLTILALAFAFGIAVGKYQPEPMSWSWLVVAFSFLLTSFLRPVRSLGLPAHLVTAAMIALGAAWFVIKTERTTPDDLSTHLGEESRLVKVRGVAAAGPTLHRSVRGSLASFSYRSPSAYFPATIEQMVLSTGEVVPVRGKLLITIAEPVPPFRAGDSFEATGHFNPFDEPRNYGEINREELAKGLGQAGSLYLPKRELLQTWPAERWSWHELFLSWRETLQRRADAHLLGDLPGAEAAERDALLKALLLGKREPDLHELDQAFARLGISHFLAISGLHVGIFVGFIMIALRLWTGDRPAHAWLIIMLVLGYLVLVEVRVPVMRAGVMTIAACLGLGLSRRLHPGGLVAISGIGLLIWRPDQLFWPGFQLSFAVVLGLIYLAPTFRARWLGAPDTEASTFGAIAREWLKNAVAISIVAWLVATPIIVFHFGMVSPLGIPLAIVGVPIVALLLALGYAKILLAAVFPSVALILGILLSLTADISIAVIETLDRVPYSLVYVPFPAGWPGVLWTLLALALVWTLLGHPNRLPRGTGILSIAALALWLMWPSIAPRDYALRIDMLSVGHGACFVLRSGDETLVFDAGSNSQTDAADRWIIPAMRRLNIHRVDSIIISHPHFDHFASVLELTEAFKPQVVFTTHQFIEYGREHPDSAVAYVADVLTNEHRTPPRPIYAGETQTCGEATLTWLHPPKNLAAFSRDNEHSMVIRIDVAGRTVLLTGDVERAGTAGVLAAHPELTADVLEMPHHGAWHELSADLLRQAQPSIVLQSSSRSQWQRDRWKDALEEMGAVRHVTHRDGAAWVEIAHDGTIRHGNFRSR